jgi:hypothetical protein
VGSNPTLSAISKLSQYNCTIHVRAKELERDPLGFDLSFKTPQAPQLQETAWRHTPYVIR